MDSGKFGWLQLQNSAEEGESSLVETQKRGHARSTSLDLNKMLQGDGSASGKKVVRVWLEVRTNLQLVFPL